MSIMSQQLAIRFRELRKMKGLSQEDLAFKANLATSYISQIECGLKKPTIESIEKITNALEISLFDLFSDAKFLTNFDSSPISDKIILLLSSCTELEKIALYNILKEIIDLKK